MEIWVQASVINGKNKGNAQFAQYANEVLHTFLWVWVANRMLIGIIVSDNIGFFKGITTVSFEQVLCDFLERSFKSLCWTFSQYAPRNAYFQSWVKDEEDHWWNITY